MAELSHAELQRRVGTARGELQAKCGLELHDGARHFFSTTITLPDDPALASMTPAQVQLDLACGLFASGRVSRSVAARIAGLGSLAFDEELFLRKIPSFTEEMLDQDLAALERLHGR